MTTVSEGEREVLELAAKAAGIVTDPCYIEETDDTQS